MVRDPLGSSRTTAVRPRLSPLRLLIAGAAVAGLAAVLTLAGGDRLQPLRVGLILSGLALAMFGVNSRLRNFGERVEERATTAAYLALGAFVVLLAYLACGLAWDSFRLVLGVFVAVCLVGAALVLLPQMIRRAVILVLVFFHFVGILTAVFSVPPPNGVSCWTTSALWTYIYRPYLQFMYLNNAYHFYSPEPGPATQLWFCVRYDDPKLEPRWVQYPRREDYPSRLSYQRSLAMSETTTYARYGGYPEDFFGPNGRVMRRFEARVKIPYHITLQADKGLFAYPDVSQYREPNDITSKKYIASYARHVARDPRYRHPDAPDVPVQSVKVYRVLHTILSPPEMAQGIPPEDRATLLPVYVGEFDRDGDLLDPTDPLLYWVVPIMRERDKAGQIVLKEYVSTHAGCPCPFASEP